MLMGYSALGEHSDAAGGLNDPLYLAIRSQANFIENVPLAMIMALLAEINGADRYGSSPFPFLLSLTSLP